MDFDWNDPKVAEQMPINQAIAEALIDSIPESWQSAELDLGFEPDGGVSHRVVCPDTGEGGTPSFALAQATAQLDQHRKKFGLGWRSARYAVRINRSGDWQVSANFV